MSTVVAGILSLCFLIKQLHRLKRKSTLVSKYLWIADSFSSCFHYCHFMQIMHVNHYHNHLVWNTIIYVVFHIRNINSVCLPLPVEPDEKLHSIFFMCDNKINWIPQLFRNRERKYFKRSWSKRIGKQFSPTVISCLTAQQFSTNYLLL